MYVKKLTFYKLKNWKILNRPKEMHSFPLACLMFSTGPSSKIEFKKPSHKFLNVKAGSEVLSKRKNLKNLTTLL